VLKVFAPICRTLFLLGNLKVINGTLAFFQFVCTRMKVVALQLYLNIINHLKLSENEIELHLLKLIPATYLFFFHID